MMEGSNWEGGVVLGGRGRNGERGIVLGREG